MLTPISFKASVIHVSFAPGSSDVFVARTTGLRTKLKPMPGTPCRIERLPPRRVEKADQAKSADDQQRPLQGFRPRDIEPQMIEQRQIGKRPKRNESRPVEENGAQRNPRMSRSAASPIWNVAAARLACDEMPGVRSLRATPRVRAYGLSVRHGNSPQAR